MIPAGQPGRHRPYVPPQPVDPTTCRVCDPCTNGDRCEVCGDRMCADWGPEPQTGCRTRCTDCPQCPCMACHEARWDVLLDRQAQVERDAGWGL